MKFRYGHYRYVLVFKNFVIKFPRIRLWSAFNTARKQIIKKRLLWYLKRFKYKSRFSIQRALFKGIVDNWFECLFYKRTHYSFLVPTYYSFFGLVNIQARGQIWDSDNFEYWDLLCEITNSDVYDDSHEFVADNNYGFHQGRLKMFDYGSKQVINILTKYADQLERKFNIRDNR